jgi:hypothetical protein
VLDSTQHFQMLPGQPGLAEEAGFRPARHGQNKYHCPCPHHKNWDKHPRTSFYGNRFYCHTSGGGWDAIDLARLITGGTVGDGIRWLAAGYGITQESVRFVPKPEYALARKLATKAVDIRAKARKALLVRILRLSLLRLKLAVQLKRVEAQT